MVCELDSKFYDVSAVTYGGHVTRDGQRKFNTPVSAYGSVVIIGIAIMYVIGSLAVWTEEFYFQVLSDNEGIEVNSKINEDIFELLEAKISGLTSESLLLISIGASFELDGEGIMTLQNNCTATQDNFPMPPPEEQWAYLTQEQLTQIETLQRTRDYIRSMHLNDSNACLWGQDNANSGKLRLATIYLMQIECVTFDDVEVSFQSLALANNRRGYSERVDSSSFGMRPKMWQNQYFRLGTVDIKKNSIWGFGSPDETRKYFLEMMDSSAPDFEAAVLYFSHGSPFIQDIITDSSCIAIIEIELGPLIHTQDIFPENLLTCFSRIGGFLGIVGLLVTILGAYNSYQLMYGDHVGIENKHDFGEIERRFDEIEQLLGIERTKTDRMRIINFGEAGFGGESVEMTHNQHLDDAEITYEDLTHTEYNIPKN